LWSLGFKITLVLAVFSLHKLTEALDFVKNNAEYSLEQTDDGLQRQLRVTGVFYSQKFASTVESQLNLRSDYNRFCFIEVFNFNGHSSNYCKNLTVYESRLPQTDPRDVLRYAHSVVHKGGRSHNSSST